MLSDILEWLYEIVHQVTLTLGYPGIFMLMLVENLFPPIPSEIVMPFAGFMVQRGELNIAGVLAAGALGSLAGAFVIYKLSQKLGEERVRAWIRRHGRFLLLSEQDLRRALDVFTRHGKLAILIGRLIPGVRSLISIPAGLENMEMKRFLALTLAGSLLWNSLLAGAGYILGSSWQRVLDLLDAYEVVILITLGLLLLVFIGKRLSQKTAGASD